MHAVKTIRLCKPQEIIMWGIIICTKLWTPVPPNIAFPHKTVTSDSLRQSVSKVRCLSWIRKYLSNIYWINPPCQLIHLLWWSPARLRGSMRPPASLTGLSPKPIFGPPAMPLNGQEKWISASHNLCSTPTNPLAQSSAFKYCSGRNQDPGPGVFHWPTQHTHNLLDTLSTLASNPPPPRG